MRTVLGHTEAPLARYAVAETTLDGVLADGLREAAGTELALSNGFRFSPPIAAGPIREADLWNAHPLVGRLKAGRVTGRQLREFWERELEHVFSTVPARRFGGWLPRPAGMTVRFEAGAPRGERLRDLRIDGAPVANERLYTIVSCDREGDPPDTLCRIPRARDVRRLEVDAHEAVRRFLARHPNLAAPAGGRVVGVDLPPVLRAQLWPPART